MEPAGRLWSRPAGFVFYKPILTPTLRFFQRICHHKYPFLIFANHCPLNLPPMATISTRKRLLARLLILAVLIGVVWFVRHRQQAAQQLPSAPTTSTNTGQTTGNQQQNPTGAPAYVLNVLNYVRRNGQAPDGFVGGKEFQNREKKLPAKDGGGKKIRYSEWDVQPKVQGKNRGPERLVTGSDHSAWYTRDHYKNFLKID